VAIPYPRLQVISLIYQSPTSSLPGCRDRHTFGCDGYRLSHRDWKTRWSFLVAEIIEIHKSLNRLEEFNGDLSVIVAKLGTKRQASKS
jgi:hypothetical protein